METKILESIMACLKMNKSLLISYQKSIIKIFNKKKKCKQLKTMLTRKCCQVQSRGHLCLKVHLNFKFNLL